MYTQLQLRYRTRLQPASSCGHRFPLSYTPSFLLGREWRACCGSQPGSRAIAAFSRTTTPNYPLNTHAPDQTATTASTSPVSSRPRHPEPLKILPNFHGVLRANRPCGTASELCPEYRKKLHL